MRYENDFVNEEKVLFEIEGRKFEYKPTTAGEESSWLNDIMTIKEGDAKPTIDWDQYNKKKLTNILSVPYTKENIHMVLKVQKEWPELTSEQKFELLGKLRPGLYDKIINAIRNIDEPDTAVKN